MSGLNISPTEKTQELLSAAKDLALENSNTQVSTCVLWTPGLELGLA